MRVEARTMSSAYLEWAKLCAQAKYNLAASGIAGYPLSQLTVKIEDLQINGPTIYGYPPLLERLAHKYGVATDCVVLANGAAMANHLAMAAVITPGDDVLIERPTYGPILDVASYLGANILRFDRRREDDFQIDVDGLGAKLTPKTRLIVITNLHNPTGAFTSSETLITIADLASKAGALVLVDEVYLDMLFETPVRSSFHLGQNVVVTNSLTKAYGLSGLRCGWVLAQSKLAQRMWRLNDLFGVTVAHPAELLSVIALDHLNRIKVRAAGLLRYPGKGVNADSGASDFEDCRTRATRECEIIRHDHRGCSAVSKNR